MFVVIYEEKAIDDPPRFPGAQWEKIRLFPDNYISIFYSGKKPSRECAEAHGRVVDLQDSDEDFKISIKFLKSERQRK
jgi:hypothetical protein